MKVLKPGRQQTGYTVEAKCTGHGNGLGGCGAELLVEQPDMVYYKGSDYPIQRDSAVMFRCVSCGVLTDLPRAKWPPHPTDLPPFSTAWSKGQKPLESEK